MYEELIERLRDPDNCDVLDDVDKAADAIEALEKQFAEKESEIVRIRNSWSNTISDLSSVTTKQWTEKASDNTDFVLAYADGLYSVSDGKGRILCEFIRDSGADVCVESQTVGGEKYE